MVVPPKHLKMIVFSRKTQWLLGTTILGNPHMNPTVTGRAWRVTLPGCMKIHPGVGEMHPWNPWILNMRPKKWRFGRDCQVSFLNFPWCFFMGMLPHHQEYYIHFSVGHLNKKLNLPQFTERGRSQRIEIDNHNWYYTPSRSLKKGRVNFRPEAGCWKVSQRAEKTTGRGDGGGKKCHKRNWSPVPGFSLKDVEVCSV